LRGLAEIGNSTTEQMVEYFKAFMLPSATKQEVDLLLQYYPDDPKAGCPFDTGLRNILGMLIVDPCAVDSG
jgi:acetylcholinesterase